jgi:hypothetical protein
MAPRSLNFRRVILGVVVVVALVFGFIMALRHDRDAVFATRVRDAERTVDILRPMIAADARFREVSVSMTTGPGVWLVGTVASTNDWDALRRLVEQTPIPFHANLAVGLDTNPPNKTLQATATAPSVLTNR